MEQKQSNKSLSAKLKIIAYWLTTGIIVLESAAGAEWDLVRNQQVRDVFSHLGYPLYLLTILGVWKLPAALMLIAPRFVLVKEWAYAGLFFVYSGASISNFIMGDYGQSFGTAVFALVTLTSWALRPPSRKIKLINL